MNKECCISNTLINTFYNANQYKNVCRMCTKDTDNKEKICRFFLLWHSFVLPCCYEDIFLLLWFFFNFSSWPEFISNWKYSMLGKLYLYMHHFPDIQSHFLQRHSLNILFIHWFYDPCLALLCFFALTFVMFVACLWFSFALLQQQNATKATISPPSRSDTLKGTTRKTYE